MYEEKVERMVLTNDLTVGDETKAILKLVLPMIIGNLFQQLYNVADTIIVGKFIGPNALAAVGSSFSVMVLLNSIILGLCMGSSTVFSIFYGVKEIDKLKNSIFVSSCIIGLLSLVINNFALVFIDEILTFLRIPVEVWFDTKTYLQIIFYGILFTSAYNFFAAIMRSLGNTTIPLIFLIISAIINIVWILYLSFHSTWVSVARLCNSHCSMRFRFRVSDIFDAKSSDHSTKP